MSPNYPIYVALILLAAIIGTMVSLLLIGLIFKQPDEWENKHKQGKNT